ncbi:hypothetical protein CYMTET_13600 [Cymbomonas tetramitiformis]|uniref:Uncharacterized protein n=1 Tax=Cymbomonas tetramitiformis TaxID=36881 RepID=A0AAE0LB94_9CHLO|nr:hypothetical protein CYMTET_13600 [Cymbomonas tetramitiformis]
MIRTATASPSLHPPRRQPRSCTPLPGWTARPRQRSSDHDLAEWLVTWREWTGDLAEAGDLAGVAGDLAQWLWLAVSWWGRGDGVVTDLAEALAT